MRNSKPINIDSMNFEPMRSKRLRRLTVLLALFLFCLLLLPARSLADDSSGSIDYKNPDSGYIVVMDDRADLLTTSQERDLTEDMKPITTYGSVAFVSVDQNSSSTSSFARNYYYDLFGSGRGTIFVIDMDNRNIYIFSNGTVYEAITDTKAEVITDNTYRYASNEDYYGCAAEAYRQILTLLEGNRIAQPMKYISNALLALILAFLINFGIVVTASRLNRPAKDTILRSAKTSFTNTQPEVIFLHETQRYDPVESSSGGSSGGGSRSGGGGGGGGGGHSF